MTPLREDGIGNVDFAQYSFEGRTIAFVSTCIGIGTTKALGSSNIKGPYAETWRSAPIDLQSPRGQYLQSHPLTLHQAALKLRIKDILGRDDHWFVDISVIKLTTTIRKSNLG